MKSVIGCLTNSDPDLICLEFGRVIWNIEKSTIVCVLILVRRIGGNMQWLISSLFSLDRFGNCLRYGRLPHMIPSTISTANTKFGRRNKWLRTALIEMITFFVTICCVYWARIFLFIHLSCSIFTLIITGIHRCCNRACTRAFVIFLHLPTNFRAEKKN